MLVLKAVILGIIEGVTEFLPISSTGHLILTAAAIDYPQAQRATFEIFIQLGAILAVVWHYRDHLFGLLRRAPNDEAARGLLLKVMLAFFPAALAGLLFHHAIEEHLFRPIVVAATLILGGIVIIAIERRASARPSMAGRVLRQQPRLASIEGLYKNVGSYLEGPANEFAATTAPSRPTATLPTRPAGAGRLRALVAAVSTAGPADVGTLVQSDIEASTWREAGWVGVAQVFSLIPGVSRAAATIIGGMLAGMTRPTATQFSFYLSIPTLAAASLYSLFKARHDLAGTDALPLAVGFVVSFVMALMVVRGFIGFVQRHTLSGFGYYRIALGLAVLAHAALSR
jgi:undecaprenyl-diphosphatase